MPTTTLAHHRNRSLQQYRSPLMALGFHHMHESSIGLWHPAFHGTVPSFGGIVRGNIRNGIHELPPAVKYLQLFYQPDTKSFDEKDIIVPVCVGGKSIRGCPKETVSIA